MFSEDRWDIKAIYNSLDETDKYIQNAKVTSTIDLLDKHLVTWRNSTKIEPLEVESLDLSLKSNQLLVKMFELEKNNEITLKGDSKIIYKNFTYFSPKYTAPLFKAPMSIQYLAQLELLKFK